MNTPSPPLRNEPGYVVSIVLMLALAGLFFLANAEFSSGRGHAAPFASFYATAIGLMFLASYYFSHKSFLLRGFMWVCEHFSRPRGRRMAFFYSGVFLLIGVGGLIQSFLASA